jgi:segregation and condensation protein A
MTEVLETADAAEEEIRHLAKVQGELWTDLPTDLYIPPDALEVILEAFEGPLDLLLWLIRRNNLDVLNINMAALTVQYMAYVDVMRQLEQTQRLELAAEYLVMAAMLIEIKSRMLLPRPEKVEEGVELDPRAELVRRLLEYEQMKLAAHNLDDVPQLGRDFEAVNVYVSQLAIKRLPLVGGEDLLDAWRAILKRASLQKHHRIGRQELSVREHMSRILKHLQNAGRTLFTDLFEPADGRSALVVTFLALLELVRERLVDIVQNEAAESLPSLAAYESGVPRTGAFAPIYAQVASTQGDSPLV